MTHHIPLSRIQAAVFLLPLLCTGCGRNDGLPLAEVTGLVTLDGQPVEGAGIEFIPQEPGKSVAYGKTDENGRYKMHFGSNKTGAFIGRNLVRIYCDDRVTVAGQQYERTELFPPRYNVKSEEYVDVVDGENEINFACEAGDFKARQKAAAGAGT